MFKHFGTFFIALLALQANLANCQLTGISWVFRGTAQQNNTVLTFNMYDTMNLICRGASYESKYYLTFALTKGSSAPTMMTIDDSGDYYKLTVSNAGTLVWDDMDGLHSGFENVVVFGDFPTDYTYYAQYTFRYMSIGTLRTTDSGTYHCSVCYESGGSAATFGTSGALTIQVNTKSGQAMSSRNQFSNILTYSALIMGASKFLF